MRQTRFTLGLGMTAVVSLCAACNGSETRAPADFYTAPDPLPSDVPGTLIRAEPMEPFTDDSLAWRVLYVSTAVDGTPIAVSGMVAAPAGPAPEGGRDVVSWAHGLTGLEDRCAPSRGFRFFGHDFYELAPEIVAAGYVGVATDYEGLGTPGVHPYLVGPSEGRGVLDIVKAAQQVEDTYANDRVVVWGLSQGGHAALFAGEIAPSWAPELEVLGVAATAPGGELDTVAMSAPLFPRLRFILWYIAMGFEAAYDELSMNDVFDPDTLGTIEGLVNDEACFEEFEAAGRDFEGPVFMTNPVELSVWKDRLSESSPGYAPIEAPVLVLQSEDDPTVPIVLTNVTVDRLCAIGSEVDYRVLQGLGHDETSRVHVPTVIEWIGERFAGQAASSACE